MISNELSFKDLEDMAVLLGLSDYNFKSREEIANIIRDKINIKLKFY